MQDPFLKSLNATVNNYDYTFGITLIVDGGVISGTLISAKSYFDGFSDSFSGAWPGGSEVLRDGLAEWGQPHAEELNQDFVHLKDAHYITGTEFAPSGGGMLWRGSLESVNGFSLGTFTRT